MLGLHKVIATLRHTVIVLWHRKAIAPCLHKQHTDHLAASNISKEISDRLVHQVVNRHLVLHPQARILVEVLAIQQLPSYRQPSWHLPFQQPSVLMMYSLPFPLEQNLLYLHNFVVGLWSYIHLWADILHVEGSHLALLVHIRRAVVAYCYLGTDLVLVVVVHCCLGMDSVPVDDFLQTLYLALEVSLLQHLLEALHSRTGPSACYLIESAVHNIFHLDHLWY